MTVLYLNLCYNEDLIKVLHCILVRLFENPQPMLWLTNKKIYSFAKP